MKNVTDSWWVRFNVFKKLKKKIQANKRESVTFRFFAIHSGRPNYETDSLAECVYVCVSILMAMTAAKFTLRLHYCKQNASAYAFSKRQQGNDLLKGPSTTQNTQRHTHTDTEAENEK